MTVVGPNTIQPPNKRKKPTPRPEMKKEDQERFNRKKRRIEEEKKAREAGKVIKHPKKPDKPKAGKPANKRTGQDYLDFDDLRKRIRADEENRRKNRRPLPRKI